MNEELKQEVNELGKHQIINSRIKVADYLNIGDMDSSRPRRNSYNPMVEEFLDEVMRNELRSESAYNVNKIRQRVASSSRGKHTSD